ncbi:MAG: fasciclin domain-containing protein [Hydrococcus sp. C42_A2020_068]|nr:fasciclin domain-containing protein [Hydrococcus sp. C42_A2020_068]
MKKMSEKSWLKKLSGFIGVAGVSTLLSFPVLAQYYYPPSSFFQPTANYYESEQEPIVDILLKSGEFKTFNAYLKETGIVETLKGEKMLTIFAPTNEAFEALPENVREKLSQPENLEKVLKYHLVAGLIAEEDIKRGEIATIEGHSVKITGVPIGDRVGVKLNEAMASDPLKANDGTIVPIDEVLLPPNF